MVNKKHRKEINMLSRLTRVVLFVIALLFSLAHAGLTQINSEAPVVIGMTHTSIINLIANPQRFNEYRVRVVGHVRLREEATAVYLSASDAAYEITKNGVWLDVTNEFIEANKSRFDGKVCLIEARFSLTQKGFSELWSGALEDITTIEVLGK